MLQVLQRLKTPLPQLLIRHPPAIFLRQVSPVDLCMLQVLQRLKAEDPECYARLEHCP
jgi:hypothetical protein